MKNGNVTLKRRIEKMIRRKRDNNNAVNRNRKRTLIQYPSSSESSSDDSSSEDERTMTPSASCDIKLNNREQLLFQQALLLTVPSDKQFWVKVSRHFNLLGTEQSIKKSLSPAECQQYYQSLNSSSTTTRRKKKESSETASAGQDGYEMAEKLQNMQKGTKKMTRKRTIRDILKWADEEHRDDLFLKNHKKRRTSFNLASTGIDDEDEVEQIRQHFPEADTLTRSKQYVTPKKARKFDFSNNKNKTITPDKNSPGILRTITNLKVLDTYVAKLPKGAQQRKRTASKREKTSSSNIDKQTPTKHKR